MLLNNLYICKENPEPIENIMKLEVYSVMNELCNKENYESLSLDSKNNIKVLFDESTNCETYTFSQYRLLGWVFDFSDYTDRYLVNDLYSGWKEIRAFNENLIYDLALYPENILEVVKI